MSIEAYTRKRRQLYRKIADQCFERAMISHSPTLTAKWAALIDALLWAASDEGDTSSIDDIAWEKERPDA